MLSLNTTPSPFTLSRHFTIALSKCAFDIVHKLTWQSFLSRVKLQRVALYQYHDGGVAMLMVVVVALRWAISDYIKWIS